MGIVITFSGLHGTGKSTYSKAVSTEFNLRYISAGKLFRRIAKQKNFSLSKLSKLANKTPTFDQLIDNITLNEAKKGSVVLDGLLTGWIVKDYADLKIYLKASQHERIKRIANRESLPFKIAKENTLLREKIERIKFKRIYNIDIDDISIYDLVFNTNLLSKNSNISVIIKFIQEYISNMGRD